MTTHENQITDYPKGARVEAIREIPLSSPSQNYYADPLPRGIRGIVTAHTDDGRAWINFDGHGQECFGHTFEQPEKYIRVVCTHRDDNCPANHEQPRPEQAGGETTGECGFDEAWIGKCKQIGNPRCAKHTGRVCVSCGADAVRNCEETGQFVCGADLCGDCEHTIFPSGTNGGIGFNAQSLPEGMSRHCKKTEQKFKPWYARDDNEDDDAPAAPERGEWHVHQNKREIVDERGFYVAFVTDESTAMQIVTEHNQHSTLIAQRERLIEALSMLVCNGCHNRIGWTETPTKYGDWTKCSSCRAARQLLTTIKQKGNTFAQ